MTPRFSLLARFSILSAGVLLAGAPAAAQVELFFEDFEDATIGYTTSVPDDLGRIANGDYFGRIAPDTSPPPGDAVYTNLQGNGFYGAQDTNGVDSGDFVDIELLVTGVNITNFENLVFSWFVAEDDADNGGEDWDTSSSVLVEFQIDGGGFTDLFAIESELGTDGNETNELPRVDTDFDGTGDGDEITPAFTEFELPIAGSGSTLDLRISIADLDTGDEDIAFDNLLITGSPDDGADPDGDYNGDGLVTAEDYAQFRDTFGQQGADLPADGDNSGEIDAADYNIWAANFTGVGGQVATAVAVVPEPHGLLLAVIGGVGWPRRRTA